MAIAYVVGANGSGTGTTRTGTFGGATAIGDLIIVMCLTTSTTAVTMTVSDTVNSYTNFLAMQTGAGSTGPTVYAWWAIASTGATLTYTVTLSSSVGAGSYGLAYNGTSTTAPIDGTPAAASGTSTAPLGGNVTTSRSTDWFITACTAAGATFTAPTGFTNRETTGNVAGHADDSNGIVATGTYDPAWAITPSGLWVVANFAITPPFSAVASTLMMMGVGM